MCIYIYNNVTASVFLAVYFETNALMLRAKHDLKDHVFLVSL